jgi:hypothetical protein
LQPRTHNFNKSRLGDRDLRARSADPGAETERSRVGSILEKIENSRHAAEQERSGLNRWIENVPLETELTNIWSGSRSTPSRLSGEISNGRRRLKEFATSITHLRFL